MNKLVLISLFVSACVSPSVSSCGVQKVVNELIVNGKTTVRGEWPWHVAIYKNESYACGGTLVTKLHVITAEHCVQNATLNEGTQLIEDIFVRLGVHWLNLTYPEEQRRNIKEIHIFPKNHLRNDIAILQLDAEVKFGVYVQPACVSLAKNLTGKLGTVVGWGADETGRFPNELKSARMPVVDIYTCLASDRDIFGQTLDEGIVCAGYTNGTAVCNGDSGGGIFFNAKGAWHLGGIVAFSKFDKMSRSCYVHGYGAFTKIYRYICWIKQVTKLPIDDDQCENEGFDTDENYTELFPQDCGINSSDRFGTPNYPWMAILRYETSLIINGYCEGTLIHKRYVLTHALCTSRFTPYQVQFGKQYTTGQSRNCNRMRCVRDYGIESIILHPVFAEMFAHENTTTSRNSIEIPPSLTTYPNIAIALIRLNQDVDFDEFIRPVCLPVTPQLKTLSLSTYVATGWQFGYNSRPSSSLLRNTVAADPAYCRLIQQYVNISSTDLLCMNEPSRVQVCNLNFGDPLGNNVKYQDGERFVQFGVVFNSQILFSCDFTHAINVGKHMDWIVANVRT